EGFRHAGDLHPRRDAAGAQHVDHHDIDRAVLEQMAEGRDPVDVFAGRDRCAQRVGDAAQARIIVVRRRFPEPVEIKPGAFAATASTWVGSSPTRSSPSVWTADLRAGVSAPPKNVTPMPTSP